MISLKTLLDGIAPAPDLDVLGLATDSRYVRPGDVFLAVRGVASHGLQYLDTALENGASAVLWEPTAGVPEPDDVDVPLVPVPNLSRHAGSIAARFHRNVAANLFTVGVTGTDGKTSTTYLVAQALDALGSACAYLGTIGYGRVGALKSASHTTPEPVRLHQMIADFASTGAQAVAMEVSSHALDQARVAGLRYDAAVLTNLTRDHLDYHGTVEAYAAAKKKLFTEYTRGAAILNRDDATGAAWAAEFMGMPALAARVTMFGIEGETPAAGQFVLARAVQLSPDGIRFTVDTSWGQGELSCRLLGRFNVYNLLAALAVLLQKGVALQPALAALAGVHTVPGRIEGYRAHGGPLVVVDYAHTPEALAQILSAVRAHTPGKLLCVFGCGGDRDRGKRPLMGQAAVLGADVVYVTDDNPRSEEPSAIAADIVGGIRSTPQAARLAAVIHDRATAIRTAIAQAEPDDVVVVAGKGHETTQTVGRETREFSDRAFIASLTVGRV